MNDLLNDIEKLEKLDNLLWEKDLSNKFSRKTISTYIQEMIEEKQKIVDNFEMECSECGHKEMGVSI